MKRFWFSALLVAFGVESTALAKPATTLKLPDVRTFESATGNPWFAKLDLSSDLGFKGTTGFGLSAGHTGDPVFWDVSIQIHRTTYGGVGVAPSGYSPSWQPDTSKEVGRARASGDTGSMFAFGPGVGFMYKLFQSEHWVEMGRFGVNYGSFNDSTNGISFRGWIINMQGGAGYQIGRLMLCPSISWNLGYMSSRGSDSAGFLPLQWFSLHGSVLVWL